jgi:hypothetical protein
MGRIFFGQNKLRSYKGILAINYNFYSKVLSNGYLSKFLNTLQSENRKDLRAENQTRERHEQNILECSFP